MLIARSSLECHLYMELHPCVCGEARGPWEHHLASVGDDLVAVYAGSCPRCGTARRFELVLDPEMPPFDKFGGIAASRIIDAGQFLAVADAAAKAVPGDTSRLDQAGRERAHELMARAMAALEEVMKFIPDGASEVPVEALFTEEGRRVHEREPGRFRRSRLEAVLGVYRKALG